MGNRLPGRCFIDSYHLNLFNSRESTGIFPTYSLFITFSSPVDTIATLRNRPPGDAYSIAKILTYSSRESTVIFPTYSLLITFSLYVYRMFFLGRGADPRDDASPTTTIIIYSSQESTVIFPTYSQLITFSSSVDTIANLGELTPEIMLS